MALEFTTRAKKKKNRGKINFTLDGEEYEFTPPKTALLGLAILEAQGGGGDGEDGSLGVAKAMFDYLDAGLPEDQSQRIMDRLRDPGDDFDLDDLAPILNAIVTENSERPTK